MALFGGMKPAGDVAENAVDALYQLPEVRSYLFPEATAWQANLLELAKRYAPEYANLSGSMYETYGPKFAQLDSDIARQRYLADLATAKQAGPAYVEAEAAMAPEYAAARSLIGKGFQDLLSGMSPNELTGSEREQIVRGVNRTNISRGTANVGSQSEALKNVTTFGSELAAKKERFAAALGSATNFLNPSRTSAIPSYNVNNFGINTQYPGVGSGYADMMNQWGRDLYGTGSQASLAAQYQPGVLDRIGQLASTVSGVGGAIGSFGGGKGGTTATPVSYGGGGWGANVGTPSGAYANPGQPYGVSAFPITNYGGGGSTLGNYYDSSLSAYGPYVGGYQFAQDPIIPSTIPGFGGY